MPHKSVDLKKNLMIRMIPPHNESAITLSRETGIPLTTLQEWKRSALAEARCSTHGSLIQPEVVALQRKLKRAELDKKTLEKALRKKEAELARAESQLSLQAKPGTIWGLGDD